MPITVRLSTNCWGSASADPCYPPREDHRGAAVIWDKLQNANRPLMWLGGLSYAVGFTLFCLTGSIPSLFIGIGGMVLWFVASMLWRR